MDKARAASPWVWPVLLVLLPAAVWVALVAGHYPLRAGELLAALVAGPAGAGLPSDAAAAHTVVWQLRLPRIVAALMLGGGLAVAGATYQTIFRNPLVSPDILGVSAGAGLGAVTAIVLDFSVLGVQTMAFCGGLAAVGVVMLVASRVRRHDPVLVLVLAGVAIAAFLGAGISLIKVLADPYGQLASITFWLLGGLSAVGLADVTRALPWLLAGLVPMVLLRWRINLLSLPDEEARALGVEPRRYRAVLIVAATVMTAGVVSFAGIVGWVGLLVPHIARLLAGPIFSRLLPASLLLGAVFVVITDTLARTASSLELPLGVLTALAGAPFFLMILARRPS